MYKIILLFIVILFGCSETKNKVNDPLNTVKGTILPSEMGLTLIHEHVLVDFIGADSTGYHRWNKDSVVEKMLPYFLEAKEQGVKTVIETTPMFLGRDVLMLKKLADKSGLNFITNTGLYGAVNDKYLPSYAFDVSVDSLSAMWVSEYENGIENTGIRPGFMKISVDPDSMLSAVDEKIVRAAALTHVKTGMTIVSHTGPDQPAFRQLEILGEMGVSPAAWVWTHAQNGTDEGRLKAAREGAWISLDNVMQDNFIEYLEMIDVLKNAGYLNKVLISHDAGYYDPDADNGGAIRGYTAIFTHLLPGLEKKGYIGEEIDQLLIKNPENAYTIQVRRTK